MIPPDEVWIGIDPERGGTVLGVHRTIKDALTCGWRREELFRYVPAPLPETKSEEAKS